MIRSACTVAAATTLWIARPTLTKAIATNANSKLPTLRGVVFDMDDTLVRSNLDIRAMYKEVFGSEPAKEYDILKDIAAMETADEKARAFQIIQGIEQKSREQMTLMPGCTEVLTWLTHHKIPKALVTRNSRVTTEAFLQTLAVQSLSMERSITRDDSNSENNIPPKPDPTAMKILAEECFGCETFEILMVGDSIANDVAFGTNAGSQTALFSEHGSSNDVAADICVSHLTQLPKKLWSSFSIAGPLGNTPEANQRPLHGSPPPEPQSDLCVAVASGNIETVRAILSESSGLEEIARVEEANGNTALIWACEKGHAEIARLLLNKLAGECQEEDLSSYINHRGFLGATALNRAARRGHTNILELLLNGPIPEGLWDKDLPNHKLQYPLHFAAYKKNPEALEYLLKKGANPWVLDRKGRTPVEDTSCETCKSLLCEAMKE